MLSNCSLLAVPQFDNLPNLARLDLSFNPPLSSVADGAFNGTPKLRELRLKGCAVCQLSP